MKRILVVDDEEAIRLLYKEELTEAGYEVELAVNGRRPPQRRTISAGPLHHRHPDPRNGWHRTRGRV